MTPRIQYTLFRKIHKVFCALAVAFFASHLLVFVSFVHPVFYKRWPPSRTFAEGTYNEVREPAGSELVLGVVSNLRAVIELHSG